MTVLPATITEAERKARQDEGNERVKSGGQRLADLKQINGDIKAQLSQLARNKPAHNVLALLAHAAIDVSTYRTKSVDDILRDVDERIIHMVKSADLNRHRTRLVCCCLSLSPLQFAIHSNDYVSGLTFTSIACRRTATNLLVNRSDMTESFADFFSSFSLRRGLLTYMYVTLID